MWIIDLESHFLRARTLGASEAAVTFPVSLWLGPLSVHPHFVFEALAYLVGARLYAFVKAQKPDPIDAEQRWWIVAAAFAGALAGSKLLVLLDHPQLTLASFAQP